MVDTDTGRATATGAATIGAAAAPSDALLKILCIGESGVGKSSLVRRVCHDEFLEKEMNTIGVSFSVCDRVLRDGSGRTVKLQVWDTAGSERFRTITASYYRGAHAVLLVYDVTSAESFRALTYWYREAARYATARVRYLVVGNKVDLLGDCHRRAVEPAALAAFIADTHTHPLEHVETSALTACGVEIAFDQIARASLPSPLESPPVSPHSDASAGASIVVGGRDDAAARRCAC